MYGSVNGNDAFSVYRCVNMYMYMHMCAIRGIYVDIHVQVFYTRRPPAFCTVSLLHSQNNLLGKIDIGAHKPLGLQAPFVRFYIFHVYYFYHFCSLLKSFVHELYVTIIKIISLSFHCHFIVKNGSHFVQGGDELTVQNELLQNKSMDNVIHLYYVSKPWKFAVFQPSCITLFFR